MEKEKALRAVEEVLAGEGIQKGEVSITFDGDKCLQDLNREFLGRDEPTDVIAFDLSHEEDFLVGDVYISVDRAAEQAMERNLPFEEELLRLQVHGILHLVGYDHDGEDSAMWERQEYWVGKFSGRTGT